MLFVFRHYFAFIWASTRAVLLIWGSFFRCLATICRMNYVCSSDFVRSPLYSCLRATPLSAVSFVTQSFAAVFRTATNDGTFGCKLRSSSWKLVEIFKMSKKFFVFFVIKSEIFFVFSSWSDRFTCLDGSSDLGLTYACTIFLLSSEEMNYQRIKIQ